MRGPNKQVVFSPPKKLSGALPTSPNINFGTCQDHSIFNKNVSGILQKSFYFQVYLCFSVFPKISYDQRSQTS